MAVLKELFALVLNRLIQYGAKKSPYMKMLAMRFVVVTELDQDEVLTARVDFKAVFTCSNVLPSD